MSSDGVPKALKIPLEFRSAPLGGTKGTKGFLSKKHIFYNQKGAAALAGPLEIKTVEIFYVSFVALPQRLKAYLGAPRWEPNDRKRVRPDAVECPTRLDRTRLRSLGSQRGAPKGQVGRWLLISYALLAQLDRALFFEIKGCKFESCKALD